MKKVYVAPNIKILGNVKIVTLDPAGKGGTVADWGNHAS